MSVTLSLFDAQAVLFHQKLEGMRGDPKVIVATSINPKMVGGILLVYFVWCHMILCRIAFHFLFAMMCRSFIPYAFITIRR